MPCPPVVYRLVKGSELTLQEGDDNLRTPIEFANSLEAAMAVSLNPTGTLKAPPAYYGASAAGTDDYTVTLDPAPALISDLIGKLIMVKADVVNAGPATLNCNALGAVNIKKNGTVDLVNGDIPAGSVFMVVFDGTVFHKVSV